MTNSNQKVSLYATWYVFSAIVFIICNSSLNLPIAASILITYTLVAIPTYNVLKSMSDVFPLKQYMYGYVGCFAAIAFALSIALGWIW
jgi:hypothetical protein